MRALVSVYDKSGLDKICKILISLNFQIFSTGGTLEYLKKSDIKDDNEENAKSKVDEMCKKLLVNLIIEDFTISQI